MSSPSSRPTSGALFLAFVKVSLLSAGGATTAVTRQVVVQERKWLDDGQFAQALALCQVLPGPNAINLATFLGHQLGGAAGAMLAFLGLTLLPFILVMSLGLAYFQTGSAEVRLALGGLGAAAAGVSFGTGLSMARKKLRDPFFMTVTLLVFTAQTLGRWHILAVAALALAITVVAPLPSKAPK